MICHLCLKDKTIKNSHIIPELFYRPLYDEKHRIITLISEGDKLIYDQKGIREKLLCGDCEQKIGLLESYISRIFSGKIKVDINYTENTAYIKGLDYKKFKLFQLSLIWRASISNHWYFSAVHLGPYEEKTRLMILNEIPGEPDYLGCMMAFYLDSNRMLQTGLIMQAQNLRIFGHRAYGFVFGGALWLYIVSNHSGEFKYSDYFFNKNGSLNIQLKSQDKILASVVKKFGKAGKPLY